MDGIMIKKEGSEYFVYNHTGKKKLSKGYSSKKEAEKRLGEIEYFKHKGDEGTEEGGEKRVIERVMKEWKEGKLKTPAGELVTSQKQAEAIALSEARKHE